MRAFVDANIFVRLLSSDDPIKAERCLNLLMRARRGELELVTSEAIVGEVIYVLSSKNLYGQTRGEIAFRLRPLLQSRGLHIDHKRSVLFALDRFESTNVGFEDCLAAEHAMRLELDGIYSYDRKLGRIPGVNRLEP